VRQGAAAPRGSTPAAQREMPPAGRRSSLRRKVRRIADLLEDEYGSPQLGGERSRRDPLESLIVTILSQNTSDTNSAQAFAQLRQRFADWRQVMEAPTRRVEEALRPGGLARIKAPRIQQVLREIAAEHNDLSLDFLRRRSLEDGVAYLTGFTGVGLKTAHCVMLFSLGKPGLPVDTHVLRVSKRLGLLDPATTMDQAHGRLMDLVPPERRYSFHLNVVQHGRRICKAPRPLCERCPLPPVCDYFQRRGAWAAR
jgi:endonuclease-3